MTFFKKLFNIEEKPTNIQYQNTKTLLEQILNNEELIDIIKESTSKTACIEFIDLYRKFKEIKENTVEDLTLIAKCETLFCIHWDASFKKELNTIYGNI